MSPKQLAGVGAMARTLWRRGSKGEVYVQWAYPTSSNAVRLGFTAKGCWTVAIRIDCAPGVAVEGYASKEVAEMAATTLREALGQELKGH